MQRTSVIPDDFCIRVCLNERRGFRPRIAGISRCRDRARRWSRRIDADESGNSIDRNDGSGLGRSSCLQFCRSFKLSRSAVHKCQQQEGDEQARSQNA